MAPLLAAKFKSSRPYARNSEPVATTCWSFLSIHSSGRCLTLGILQEAAEEEASETTLHNQASAAGCSIAGARRGFMTLCEGG